jgi:hypothetical protein
MGEIVPRKRTLRAAAIATVVIVAMLLAPFCGSFCAASNGCAGGAGVSESEDRECHHTGISGGHGAATAVFAAVTTCNREELSATLPSATRNWSLPERAESTPLDSIAANEFAFSRDLNGIQWREAASAARSKDIPASTTILQI